MLDWRILAASVVAFAVLSAIFIGGFGEIFADISSGIGGWLGSDPMSGLFTKPQNGHTSISLSVRPNSLAIKPLSPVNISSSGFSAENFNGQINISFTRPSMTLQSSQTQFRATVTLSQPFQVTNLHISELKISDAGFEIEKQIKAEKGNLVIKGFSGKAVIDSSSILFEGNITSVQATVNGKNWEIR